jgi:hypothetical protein
MLSRPPALVGEADELGGGVVRVAQPAQRGRDALLLHLVEQPVAAEEEPVTDVRDDLPGVDVDVLLDAEDPGHHVRCGWLRASSAVRRPSPHEVLDEAVVLGDLLELAVVEHVHARVTDVRHHHDVVHVVGRRPARG